MQAFAFNPRADRFVAVDLPDPTPKINQLVIQPLAVGLNNRDRTERTRAADGPLRIGGHDLAGVVVASGTADFRVGQRVLAHAEHAFADAVVASVEHVVAMPQSLAAAQAAALVTPGITAWRIVHRFATIEPGQTVIVRGANGGVGALVVQLATAMGASVIGIAAARHQDAVLEAGALRAVPYDTADLPVMLANAGDVVINVALDGVGFAEDAAMTRPGGQLVTVAHVDGRAGDKRIAVVHVHPAATPTDAEALAALAPALAQGQLRVQLAAPLPFSAEGLSRGFALLDQPHDGRLVLVR